MPGGREIESLSFLTCETKGNLRRAGSPPQPPLGQAPSFRGPTSSVSRPSARRDGVARGRAARIPFSSRRRCSRTAPPERFPYDPTLTILPARILYCSAWPWDGLRRRIAVRPSRPRRGVPPHSRSRNDPCSRLHEHHVTDEQREFSSPPYSALPGASATTGLRPRVRRESFFCLGSSRQT